MLSINQTIAIPEDEIAFQAIRAQGAGGQNVNKVASAVHLRFDVRASSLPDEAKEAVLACRDKRITRDGVIVIKAQRHRTQEQNREDALERLRRLIASALRPAKPRKPTRPSRSARKRRLEGKVQRGRTKALRGRVPPSGD